MHVFVGVCVCWGQRPEEGDVSSGAGATGSCELLDTVLGTQLGTKSSMQLLIAKPFL